MTVSQAEVLEAQRALRRKAKRRYRDNRKLKRARAMTVVRTAVTNNGPKQYEVTGERVHYVAWNPPNGTICDCGNHASPCAHVMAVVLHVRALE